MKSAKTLAILALASALLVCLARVSEAVPMGTAWTYQGRLLDANSAADGPYDFQFKLFDDPCTGVQQGRTLDMNEVDVFDGYFTVELDFGGALFDGDARWLDIGVRPSVLNDPNPYRFLTPRTELKPTPYALYALQTRGIFSSEIGNVGIGTTSPAEKLEVSGNVKVSGTGNGVVFPDGTKQTTAASGTGTDSDWIISGNDMYSGVPANVGIGTTSPGAKLDVVGTTRTQVLSITGGADLAEPFPTSGSAEVPKGALLVIDEENPGQLKLSSRPYDKRVAGVVSGAGGLNPGLTLSQQGITGGGVHVALSGRVYALADSSNGPIKPGDMLTTSSMPGYAMKATDRELSYGAVIGKAMTSLEKGKGLVLVLVSLQ